MPDPSVSPAGVDPPVHHRDVASGYLPGLPEHSRPAARRGGPPPSVRALVIFQYVAGVPALVAAGAAGVYATRPAVVRAWPLPPPLPDLLAGLGVTGAVGLGAVAVAVLFLARALRAGRPPARILLLAVCLPTVVFTLWAGLTGRPAQPLVGLVLPVVYLILLNTGPARRWFRRTGPPLAAPPVPVAIRSWYPVTRPPVPWPGTARWPAGHGRRAAAAAGDRRRSGSRSGHRTPPPGLPRSLHGAGTGLWVPAGRRHSARIRSRKSV